MPHERLDIERREEILADMFKELRRLDADLLEAEGMSTRSGGKGKTREELGERFPALDAVNVVSPAWSDDDEIRRALG